MSTGLPLELLRSYYLRIGKLKTIIDNTGTQHEVANKRLLVDTMAIRKGISVQKDIVQYDPATAGTKYMKAESVAAFIVTGIVSIGWRLCVTRRAD